LTNHFIPTQSNGHCASHLNFFPRFTPDNLCNTNININTITAFLHQLSYNRQLIDPSSSCALRISLRMKTVFITIAAALLGLASAQAPVLPGCAVGTSCH
jgi:hypothetical protein